MATTADTWKTNPTIAALFSPSGRLRPLFNRFLPSSLWPHPSLLPVLGSSRRRPPRLSSLALLFPVSWSPSALWSSLLSIFPLRSTQQCRNCSLSSPRPFPPLVLQFHPIVLVWLRWGRQGCSDWKMESFSSCSQRKNPRGRMSKVALFFLILSFLQYFKIQTSNSEESVSWLQREFQNLLWFVGTYQS